MFFLNLNARLKHSAVSQSQRTNTENGTENYRGEARSESFGRNSGNHTEAVVRKIPAIYETGT